MVESVGNIVAGIGAGAARPAYASSLTGSQGDSQASGTSQVKRLSPSMRADPTTGVLVVQYLSGAGDVTTQLPSAVALAYLRSGLTATGQPKEKAAMDAGAANVLA